MYDNTAKVATSEMPNNQLGVLQSCFLPDTLQEIMRLNKNQSETISLIFERLHSFMDERTPEVSPEKKPEDPPRDAAGQFKKEVENMAINTNRLQAVLEKLVRIM